MKNQNTTQNPDVIAGRISTNVQYDIVITNPRTYEWDALCTSNRLGDAFFIADTISKTKSYQTMQTEVWVKVDKVYNGERFDVNGERLIDLYLSR